MTASEDGPKRHDRTREDLLRDLERARLEVEARGARIVALEQALVQGSRQVALADLAARLVHEINNPLAGIHNCMLLVHKGIPEDHPLHAHSVRMLRETDRLTAIVREMYGLRRLGAAAVACSELGAVAGEAAQSVEHHAARASVAFELNIPRDPVLVRISERDAHVVIVNLLRNAIDASPSGGVVRLSIAASDPIAAVEVLDSGPGIPEEIAEKMFEPFFTTKVRGVRKGEASDPSVLESSGLGLGLSIARTLAESAGGQLKHSNPPEGGALFTFLIPLAASTRNRT